MPVLLIAAGAALFLIVSGNGEVLDPIIPGGDEPKPVPELDVKLAKVIAVPTAEETNALDLRPQAEAAAQEAVAVVDQLYTEAFLNPNNWEDAEYATAFEVFGDGALPSAQTAGLETLTLGANAADTYERIVDFKGSVRFDVLFDRENQPATLAAHVKFYATGERTDATYVAIVSHGVLFLEDDGSGWRIVAYDMKRNDKEAEAPATTGASGGSPAATGATGGS